MYTKISIPPLLIIDDIRGVIYLCKMCTPYYSFVNECKNPNKWVITILNHNFTPLFILFINIIWIIIKVFDFKNN